jgi:hypothetical protein
VLTRIEIVPAQFKHIGRIARRLRVFDREECEAMGRTPKQALRLALMTSEPAWTALVDGQPEAMFGVVVESALSCEGTPWFLGTNEVYRHGRELLMYGPGLLARMGDSMKLSNFVSTRNRPAIRLLKRWGFTVGEEETVIRGVPFVQFEKAPA